MPKALLRSNPIIKRRPDTEKGNKKSRQNNNYKIIMATKTFDIKTHNLTLWQKSTASTGVIYQGRLECYGPNQETFVVNALHHSNHIATPPVCDMPGNIAYIYVGFTDFQEYVDLVRREKHVQATFDNGDPSKMNLYAYNL